MISVSKGDKVLVRDLVKCREWSTNVIAAMADLIHTADDSFFIERFDGPEADFRMGFADSAIESMHYFAQLVILGALLSARKKRKINSIVYQGERI